MEASKPEALNRTLVELKSCKWGGYIYNWFLLIVP